MGGGRGGRKLWSVRLGVVCRKATKRAILYFTGTGNCLCVARQLAGEGAELLSVRQLMKQGRFEVEADDMGLFTQSMATCSPTSGVLMMVGGQPQFAGIFSHHVADIYETEYVDHVEVLRGSGSVLYGSNAMGGVVRGGGGIFSTLGFSSTVNQLAYGVFVHAVEEHAVLPVEVRIGFF